MKNDLPYFSHDNNARNHPKMRALIVKYGYEGYGRFWALNERIAESDGAYIDISRKINKLDLASELRLDESGLDDFLKFLSDTEIDLINIENSIVTTDRINELHNKIINKREKYHRNKQADENGNLDSENKELADENGNLDSENKELADENGNLDSEKHTEENRIE